jgi:hypothetical protein
MESLHRAALGTALDLANFAKPSNGVTVFHTAVVLHHIEPGAELGCTRSAP